jgi:hypothetical protein
LNEENAIFYAPTEEDARPARQSEPEDVARLRSGLMQMVVTMKNMSLYPDTNKTNIESVQGLHRWLVDYLAADSSLVLDVGKDHLKNVDGAVVYQERPNDPILAAPLFRDGVQTLVFESGVTEPDLRTFLSVLLRFRNPLEDADDLVGALWEASLTNIRYIVASEYEQVGPEFELGALRVARSPHALKDIDAPWDPGDGPPPASQDGAPVAKPIATLFALAGSAELTSSNVMAPPEGGLQGLAGGDPLANQDGGGGMGVAVTDARAGFEGGGSDDDSGSGGAIDDYDDGPGFGPMGGAARAPGGDPPGGVSPASDSDELTNQAPIRPPRRPRAEDDDDYSGSGGGGGGADFGADDDAGAGDGPDAAGDDAGDGGEAEDDELDIDVGSVAEAFKDLEKAFAPQPAAPETNPLTLEMLSQRPPSDGPELAERLRHWNLSNREIRQVSELIKWDEARDFSFDAMAIIDVVMASSIFTDAHLPLLAAFLTNELKSSLKRLHLGLLNSFLANLRRRAEAGGAREAFLLRELNLRMSTIDVLGLLADPGPTEEALEAGYEDLRYFLYQLPEAGLNAAADLLPKVAPRRRLWRLLIEVIAYQTLQSNGRTVDLVSKLNDHALVQLFSSLASGIASLPAQTVQILARHKSAAVREALAQTLLDHDPETFHAVCGHLVLDPDPRIRRFARPALSTRRNPSVESHLMSFLRDSYTRDRHGDDRNLLEVYRILGHTASARAVPFLEEVLLRKDFKTFISRSVDIHKLGAALALFSMSQFPAARDVLDKAGRSSFRNVRQAYHEAEGMMSGRAS